MSYQVEITDTVPGTVLELRRGVRPEQVGSDIGDGLRVVGRHARPVARTVHHGGYAGIHAAYQALEQWALGHGYRSAGPPTETYLAGPDTVADPAGYRTEVSMPVVPSIGLSIRVDDDFAATVERTKQVLRNNGFGVLTEVDLRATLRDRIGADLEEFVLLGACAPELAKRAVDVDRQVGLLLPCTVAVRAERDQIVVEALDPAILTRATGLAELNPVATEARERLTGALAALRDRA